MPYTYDYPRPAVTTDIILVAHVNNETYILLIERKNDPFKGLWTFPGGFVNMDEDLDSACLRELKEETGIENVTIYQFCTFGAPGRDPRGRTITVVYISEVDYFIQPYAGDDASQAKWFNIYDLPELAFDHQDILTKFIHEILN